MAKLPRILLASGSPRRRELLNQMGIEYEVVPPELDESAFGHSDPRDLVCALAAAKASVVRDSTEGARSRWILAADTVVVADRSILNKPEDRREAEEMIRRLAGSSHKVVTGIAVWPPDDNGGEAGPTVRVASTTVSFDRLTEPQLNRYLDSDDWHDVAGGYRIQGRAALHIDSITGSYSNVVGLPIHLVFSILTELGYGPV